MASYLVVMNEIHVLLVDHDSQDLINTSTLLQMCYYRVTPVELASVAIRLLLSGEVTFDIIMANINSPDHHGFELLQQAVNMDIPIICDDNMFMAMRSIKNGALLYIKKPATMETLRCLWQHVMREKKQIIRERNILMPANDSVRGIQFKEVIHYVEENSKSIESSNMLMVKDKSKSKQTTMEEVKGANGEEYDLQNQRSTIKNKIKRKVCTHWTQELHEKFMDAVEQLGEGRCFPKEIHDLMNVPGLTRMQVASHLQRCRNDNWRSPQEEKPTLAMEPVFSNSGKSQQKPRKFGSMPRLSRVQEASEAREDDGTENMGTLISSNTSHHEHYGSPMPHPSNATLNADDFFSFQEMDTLIQNFFGLPQISAWMNASPGGYHEQNPTVPNMDSSVTSNTRRDDSETGGH